VLEKLGLKIKYAYSSSEEYIGIAVRMQSVDDVNPDRS